MIEKNWSFKPDLIGFNLTSKCNLNCKYCFEDKNSKKIDPSYDEVVTILQQIDDFGVSEVLLEGGEIFFIPFIHRLLKILPNFNFRTHIISNGTLIDRKLSEILKDINISIGISLDGPNPESNILRGSNVLNKVLSGIKELIRNDVVTYVNCTVTDSNIGLIPEFVELCQKLNVNGIVFQQLHCSGSANATFYKNNFSTLQNLKSAYDIYKVLQQKNSEIHFVDSELFDFVKIPERYSEYCNPSIKYKPQKIFRCAAGRRFCMITSNLDVIPCGIIENFPCGNLREADLKSIWENSENLNYIRNISEIRVDNIEGCKQCVYKPICDGGCRGDMFNYSGDWFATHIFCPYSNGYSQH